MSISWEPTSVIHTPLSDKVINQINARKEVYSKKASRTDQDIIYLNSNTGWIKVSSGVDVIPEREDQSNIQPNYLAKDNILFGGTFSAEEGIKGGLLADNSSYTFSEQYGYRPMAGITSFNVKNLDSFGALRQGTVEFKVNDLEQLNILEKLYMRPGYSILIEYGHSIALGTDSSGNIVYDNTVDYFDNFFDNLPKDEKKSTNLLVVEKIEGLRTGSFYNYDAFFGRITNFQWSYNSDTTYDCSIDMQGYGSVIESLSALSATTLLSNEEQQEIVDKQTSAGNDFSSILSRGIETNPYFQSTLTEEDEFIGPELPEENEVKPVDSVPYVNEAYGKQSAIVHYGVGEEDNTVYSDKELTQPKTPEEINEFLTLKEGDVFEFTDPNDKRAILAGGRNHIVVNVYQSGKKIKTGYMGTVRIGSFDRNIFGVANSNQPNINGLQHESKFVEGILTQDSTITKVASIRIEPEIQDRINSKFK